MKLTEQQKALVGAIEMLHKIGRGEQFSALEYNERLVRYKRVAVTAVPSLQLDPFYGPIFEGYSEKFVSRIWQEDEDRRLLNAFDGGHSMRDIAKDHGRSVKEIRARLVKYGRVTV